jgi:hypothetical protein
MLAEIVHELVEGPHPVGGPEGRSQQMKRWERSMTDRQTIEIALTKANELERRVRALWWTAFALGTGWCALAGVIAILWAREMSSRARIDRAEQTVLTGKPFPADVVEAQTFRVRDAAGRVRAELAMRPSGAVEMVLQDPNERARI